MSSNMEGLEGAWPEQEQLAQELEDFGTLFGKVIVSNPNEMDESSDAMETKPSTTPSAPIMQAKTKGGRYQNPRHTSPSYQQQAKGLSSLSNIDPNILHGTNPYNTAPQPVAGYQFGGNGPAPQNPAAAPGLATGGFNFTPNGAPLNNPFANTSFNTSFSTPQFTTTPGGMFSVPPKPGPVYDTQEEVTRYNKWKEVHRDADVRSGQAATLNPKAQPAALPGGRNTTAFVIGPPVTSAPTANPAPTNSLFSFNSSASATPAANPAPTNSLFSFNSSASATPAANPAPRSSPFNAPTSSSFNFGAPTSSSFSFNSGTSSIPAANPAPTNSSFNFGSNGASSTPAANPAPTSSLFSFNSGASATPAANPAPTNSSFSFNSGTSSTPAANPAPTSSLFSFNSGASATPAANPAPTNSFNFSSNGVSSSTSNSQTASQPAAIPAGKNTTPFVTAPQADSTLSGFQHAMKYIKEPPPAPPAPRDTGGHDMSYKTAPKTAPKPAPQTTPQTAPQTAPQPPAANTTPFGNATPDLALNQAPPSSSSNFNSNGASSTSNLFGGQPATTVSQASQPSNLPGLPGTSTAAPQSSVFNQVSSGATSMSNPFSSNVSSQPSQPSSLPGLSGTSTAASQSSVFNPNPNGASSISNPFGTNTSSQSFMPSTLLGLSGTSNTASSNSIFDHNTNGASPISNPFGTNTSYQSFKPSPLPGLGSSRFSHESNGASSTSSSFGNQPSNTASQPAPELHHDWPYHPELNPTPHSDSDLSDLSDLEFMDVPPPPSFESFDQSNLAADIEQMMADEADAADAQASRSWPDQYQGSNDAVDYEAEMSEAGEMPRDNYNEAEMSDDYSNGQASYGDSNADSIMDEPPVSYFPPYQYDMSQPQQQQMPQNDTPMEEDDYPAQQQDTQMQEDEYPAQQYQPPVWDFHPPAQQYQPPVTSHQIPAQQYEAPVTSHQIPAQQYEAPMTYYQPQAQQYQAPVAHYQPPVSNFQPPVPPYQPLMPQYQPLVSQYQAPLQHNEDHTQNQLTEHPYQKSKADDRRATMMPPVMPDQVTESQADDRRATMMPPAIPDHLTEPQKRQLVTGYRMKSLTVSLINQIQNPAEPLSSVVLQYYAEMKREIISAKGLPAVIGVKRKALEDDRTDTRSKRVNTNGHVTDGDGARRPVFNFPASNGKRKSDEYKTKDNSGDDYDGASDGAKRVRRDDVSYPSLPPTQTPKTVDLFGVIASGKKSTSRSKAKSIADRPIAKLRRPRGSFGPTAPNSWESPKVPGRDSSTPLAEPATAVKPNNFQTAKASGLETPAAGSYGGTMPNQSSASSFGYKAPTDTSGRPTQSSDSIAASNASTIAALAPSASGFKFTPIPTSNTTTTDAAAPSASGFKFAPTSTATSSTLSGPNANAAGSANASEGSKPTGFSVPKFGATSGSNFLAQFGQAAKKTEEETAKNEKAKRKAEDFDSDEDNEAEWEQKYEQEQQAKRQKIEDAKKADDCKFVPGTVAAPVKPAPETAPTSSQLEVTQTTASQAPKRPNPRFLFDPDPRYQIKRTQTTSSVISGTSNQGDSGGSHSSSEVRTEQAPAPSHSKPTQSTSNVLSGTSNQGDSGATLSSSQAHTDQAPTLFQFKPTQSTSSVLFGAAKPESSGLSNTGLPSSQPQTENIFGHLSNQPSDADNGNDVSEESDEDEPTPPKKQAKSGVLDQATDTSNSSSRSTSRSLFDRIETNPDGTPKREIPPPTETEAERQSALQSLLPGKAKGSLTDPKTFMTGLGRGQASASESTKPSLFAPINGSKASNIVGQASNSPSTGPELDCTWKNDSPIKFTIINHAPSLKITAPSPSKPTSTEQKSGAFTGLFGSPKVDASPPPTQASFGQLSASSSSIPGAGFNFGGPSKSLAGLSAPSVFGSPATSRGTSPGASTGAESANEGTEDDVPAEEQVDRAMTRTGEEDEDVLFEKKAKAREHATDPDTDQVDWNVRGVGVLRVLKHRETNKARIVLRVESNGKIALNSALLSNAQYKLVQGRSIMFMAARGDGNITKWMVTVGETEDAARLADMLEENKSN